MELPRRLGLVDSIAVIVGTVIGAGIFLVPNLVARHTGSPGRILAAWAVAAALSFTGGLVYAELGAMMPATGGQYVYLRAALGPLVAFLYGWGFFLVMAPAAVAWLADSFALYLAWFLPAAANWQRAIAVAVIAGLTVVNYRGVRLGALVQDGLTALKVAGLVFLVGAALLAHPAPYVPAPPAPWNFAQFGMAVLVCLMAYDGWANYSFVAGEVRDPQRTLPRALALGIAGCAALYLLANTGYLRVLGVARIAATDRVGALAAERSLGIFGAELVSTVILFSVAGAINGWMLAAPRIYFAQARDGLFFRRFAEVHPRYQTPHFAIATQGAWAAMLVLSGAYEALISYAMFFAWLFYALTALGLPILRRKAAAAPRPYRMWGYPVTPLLFAAAALALVVNTLFTAPVPSVVGLLLIASGIPVYFFWRRS